MTVGPQVTPSFQEHLHKADFIAILCKPNIFQGNWSKVLNEFLQNKQNLIGKLPKMCACTYTMQRLDEQCIVAVKIENASFFRMECFLGALFQFFFIYLFFYTQCNLHSISDGIRGGHEYCCLEMLCSGSPECASATNSKEDPLPRYFIMF